MPQLQTVDQFADKIKAKYPVYQKMDNAELVDKIIAKYPVYKDQIDFGDSPEEQDEKAKEKQRQDSLAIANQTVLDIAGVPSELQGVASAVNESVLSLLSGPVKLAKAVAFGLDSDISEQLEENPRAMPELWENYWNSLDSVDQLTELASSGTSAREYVEKYGTASPSKLAQEGHIGAAVNQTIEQTAAGAISLIPAFFGPFGAAFLGAGAAGQAFDQDIEDEQKLEAAREDGGTGYGTLMGAALTKGGVEFATELVTAGIVSRAKKMAAGGKTQAEVAEYLNASLRGTWARGFGEEFLAEGLADTGTKIADELFYGTEHEAAQVARDFFDNGLIGGIIGGKVAGVGYGALPARAKNAVLQSTKSKEHLESEKEDQRKLKSLQTQIDQNKGEDPAAQILRESAQSEQRDIIKNVKERNKAHQETIEELGPEELKDLARAKDKGDRLETAIDKAEKDGAEADQIEILNQQLEKAREEENYVRTAPAREAAAEQVIQDIEAANEALRAELQDAAKPQLTEQGKKKPKTAKQKIQEKEKKQRVKENEKLIKEAKKEGERPNKRKNVEEPKKIKERKPRIAANVVLAQDTDQPVHIRNRAFNAVLKDNAQEIGAVKKRVREKLFNQRGIKIEDATLENFVQTEISRLVKSHDPTKGAALGSRILHPTFAKKVANLARQEAQTIKTAGLGKDLQTQKQAELDEIKQQVLDGLLDPEAAEILKQDIEREYGTGALGQSLDITDTEGGAILPQGYIEGVEDTFIDQDTELDLINKVLGGKSVSELLKDIPANKDKLFALLPEGLKLGSAFSGIFKDGNPDVAIWESYFDDRKHRSALKKQIEKRIEAAKTPPSTEIITPKDSYNGALEFLEGGARKTPSTTKAQMFLPLLGKLKRSFPDTPIIISKARLTEVLIEGGYDPAKADTIRGLTDGHRVIINSERINAETPIHEFGHIWAQQTKKHRPDLYNKGVELIRNSKIWTDLVNKRDNRPDSVYYGFDDARLEEEALATAIGKRGSEIFEAKEDQSQWDELKAKIWKWINQKLGYSKVEDLTLQQFVTLAATEIVTGDEFINTFEMAATAQKQLTDTPFDLTQFREVPVGTTKNYARSNPPVREFDTHGTFKGAALSREIQPALNSLTQGQWIGWTTGKYGDAVPEAKRNARHNARIEAKVEGMRKFVDTQGFSLTQDPINPGYHIIAKKPNLAFKEDTPEANNANDAWKKVNKQLRRGLKRQGEYKKLKVSAPTAEILKSTRATLDKMGDQFSYDQLVDLSNRIKNIVDADLRKAAQTKKNIRDDVNTLITASSGINAAEKVSQEDVAANNTLYAKARRVKLSNILAPASNNDFYGLLYSLLPKGKQGRNQAKAFIDQTLLNPLEDANIEYLRLKHDMRSSWNANLKNNGMSQKRLAGKTTIAIRTGQRSMLLNVGQAVKLYNYIADPDAKLQKQLLNTGVSPEVKQAIVDFIDADPQLKAFADGIPAVYNSVAKDINDQVIAHGYEGFEVSGKYTPLTVDSDAQASYNQELEKAIIGQPGVDLYSVMSGRLKKRKGGGQIDLTSSLQQDFESYLNGPPRTAAFLDFAKGASNFFGANQLKAMEAAYGKAYADAVRDSLFRIVSGRNQPSKIPDSIKSVDRFINRAVAGVMFFNVRSFLLQGISFANYLFDDPAAFYKGAGSPAHREAIKRITDSAWFKERGLGKTDVALAELFSQSDQGKIGKGLDYILEKGYSLTKLGDKGAIVAGGSAYMAGKYNEYVNKGMEREAAWEKAYRDFVRMSEEAQQSTRPERLGQQQTTRTGKLVLAFANTPMQYNRKMAKAFQDMRGYGLNSPQGRHAAVKIAYYGAAQNLLFNMLQQLSFSLVGLDAGEEDEKKKNLDLFNSISNTILRGAGIYGALLASAKDALIAVHLKGLKGKGAVADAALQVSPAISTKVRHLRTAIGDRDPKMQSTLELSKGMYQTAAALEFANVPADRTLKLIEQVADLGARDLEDYQKLLRLGGWSRYNLGEQLGKAPGGEDQYY